ncbi:MULTISPECIES: twin-arginine translocation signal domain-containing protein [unclassified Thiocapsa]|uniref:twin-arginine translocation signal domain-containing protein n=1 Tax=unclassified Thiocapsa TaxID=2641286 RepID=UPI0035B0CDA9
MKRRDFLKQVAVGGAMSVGAVHAEAAPFWLSPTSLLPATDRAKIVFISDIHLNADPSVSWILNHLPDLADFLKALDARTDVSELIIIGDPR